MNSIDAGVVGASGLTGSELVRWLSEHPDFNVEVITSRKYSGTPIEQEYPVFSGRVNLTFQEPDLEQLRQLDLLFVAVPHGKSMDYVQRLDLDDLHVVDLGADYRLPDTDLFESVYEEEHTDSETLSRAEYGLPEYRKDAIREARLVANPGCYA
ncbi:MAG: N-acetyl-gamma-glutamyl-phosphate reductase, partial [bacterium]